MNQITYSPGNIVSRLIVSLFVNLVIRPVRAALDWAKTPDSAIAASVVMIIGGGIASYFWNNTNAGMIILATIAGLCTGIISWFLAQHILNDTGYRLFAKEESGCQHRHPTFMAWWICGQMLIALYAFGVCSYNWSYHHKDKVMVVDGIPVVDNAVRWHVPCMHDIQIIDKDMSVRGLECKGTTQDGMPIVATVDVALRRDDNPHNWTSTERMHPSRREAIELAFARACARVTSGQLAASGIQLEFETIRDGRLTSMLPSGVVPDGIVAVKDIHGYVKH